MPNFPIKTGLAMLLASIAFQSMAGVPDIQEAINRGAQIDDAVRQQQELRPESDAKDVSIDGEAGIYVLKVNEIFYVGAAAGAGWSENPLRTSDNVGDSTFFSAAFTGGVQTRIDQSFDAGLSVTVSGTQYDKNFAPSSRTVTIAANTGTQIGETPFYAGLYGYGGFNFDDNFEQSSGFYGATAAVSAGFMVASRTVVRPSLSLGRQLNQIDENDSWSTVASLDLTHIINDELTLGASARVTRTWFDDFFEDVTFVKRKDWSYKAIASMHYRPLDWLTVSATVGYERVDSTFYVSEYAGWDTQLTMSAMKRF